jgi:hypothetical protein
MWSRQVIRRLPPIGVLLGGPGKPRVLRSPVPEVAALLRPIPAQAGQAAVTAERGATVEA